jgi:hypothetical protein
MSVDKKFLLYFYNIFIIKKKLIHNIPRLKYLMKYFIVLITQNLVPVG